MSLLRVQDLVVRAGGTTLVRGVSFAIGAGESLTIIGETGSGKTLVADGVMGTLAPGLAAEGRVTLDGAAFPAADRRGRQRLWGRKVGMLPQEPWLALDPLMRAEDQVEEVHRFLCGLDRGAAMAAARKALAALGLARAERRFAFQLSGGMAQRVAFAAVTAAGAPILLADEPTKGLDAALRDTVGGLLRSVSAEGGALLTITHDIALARALGGRLAVMREGEIVEEGTADSVLSAPSHPYTRRLLQAEPGSWARRRPGGAAGPAVLQAEKVGLTLGGRTLFEDIDLTVRAGEWIAITGASGSGKTSLGNVLLGLRAPDRGRVLRRSDVPALRLQKLYQDPVVSFAAGRKLHLALSDVCRRHGLPDGAAAPMLERLRIDPALLRRTPGQVSGGELQRIALARVLMLSPALLFADEPTSRLDPISQQETITLMQEACAAAGCAVLLVTHDGALASAVADRLLRLDGPVPVTGS